MHRTLNNKELKFNAKMIIKSKPKIILHSLVYILLSYLLSMLFSLLSGYTELMYAYLDAFEAGGGMADVTIPTVKPAAMILALLLYLMTYVLAGGYCGYCLLTVRHFDAKVRNMFPQTKLMLRIILIEVVRAIIISIASAFFILPGVILSYAYKMAIYIMFDHPEYSAIKCLRESRKLMKGSKMRLFKLDLSFLGWYIAQSAASVLIGPVIDVWLEPYLGLTVASFYTNIADTGYVNFDQSYIDQQNF